MLDIKQIVAKSIHNQLPDLDYRNRYTKIWSTRQMSIWVMLPFPVLNLANCFPEKPPMQIARELASGIPPSEFFEKVEAVSGYLNFFVNRPRFMEEVLNRIIDQHEKYGASDIGKSRNIVIDYSAPNIAKPFHVGHLRSTAIGNSLRRIFEFMGYNCIGINYLGDWGTPSLENSL